MKKNESKQYACDHIIEDPKTLGSHWDAAIVTL